MKCREEKEIYCLLTKFLIDRDERTKTEVIARLESLASFYKVSKKKGEKMSLETAICEFIKNDKGYINTVSNLINVLNQTEIKNP